MLFILFVPPCYSSYVSLAEEDGSVMLVIVTLPQNVRVEYCQDQYILLGQIN